MRPISKSRLYTLIVLISLSILTAVLVHLSYNTFILYDQQHQQAEKLLIKQAYMQAITNDKLYPGGQKIIDAYLMSNIYQLDSLSKSSPLQLKMLQDSLLRQIGVELKEHSTMDSLFGAIRQAYALDTVWHYALVLNRLKLNFSGGRHLEISSPSFEPEAPSTSAISSQYLVRIGGQLLVPTAKNLVCELKISSPEDYSYEAVFSLHADRSDRKLVTIRNMLPTILLGLVCLVAMVIVYVLTLKNWRRQKRLADMKSDFINSITHEFHTPISTILVATKTFKNMQPGSSSYSLIEMIERQTNRLQNLFSQVLDITGMGGGRIQKEVTDVNAFLRELIADYTFKINDKNVRIKFDPEKTVLLELNRFYFATMVNNLLDNAVKHNKRMQKEIVIDVRLSGRHLELWFCDNGAGVNSRDIAHIFDKFYRSKDSNASGLGLGLYYVNQCVQAHGWDIRVENRKETGCCFVVTVPSSSKFNISD